MQSSFHSSPFSRSRWPYPLTLTSYFSLTFGLSASTNRLNSSIHIVTNCNHILSLGSAGREGRWRDRSRCFGWVLSWSSASTQSSCCLVPGTSIWCSRSNDLLPSAGERLLAWPSRCYHTGIGQNNNDRIFFQHSLIMDIIVSTTTMPVVLLCMLTTDMAI